MKKFLIKKIFGKSDEPGEREVTSWKEIVLYIHGLSPLGILMNHHENYRRLHRLILHEKENFLKETPVPENYLGIEWGWGSREPQRSLDMYLERAERWVGEGVFETVNKQRDWTFNPFHLATVGMRKIFLYSVTDIIYYALEEGEKTVRSTVFQNILSELYKVNSSFENLSLTFICHSAGSVIAHDFLYAIFNTQKSTSSSSYIPGLKKLRKKAQKGRVRLRKFYTFGSPITPLILRSNSVVRLFAESKTLDPREIGILPENDLKNPRWVNFWEKDDILSFPVGPIYGNPPTIEDSHPGISGFLSKAHVAYWENEKLARKIVETY